MMAKMLDVKAMKGSDVTPNTAGIESTAKMMSESSTHTSVSSSGVGRPSVEARKPSGPSPGASGSSPRLVKSRPPSKSGVALSTCVAHFTTALSAISSSSSSSPPPASSVYDEYMRKRPKPTTSAWNLSMSSRPPPMKMPRSTTAPAIPSVRHRCCSQSGTRKYSKSSTKTKRLSTESESSTMYAVAKSPASAGPRVSAIPAAKSAADPMEANIVASDC
mmetsp:Transcript_14025/g.36379  ORF Transcript_14025/g.36379 Transcript_14025/m.36379 type:complete len:219 (+) Transcript_14025:211-867(+)